MNWMDFLFGFQGRINRAKYWLFVLVSVIVMLIAGALIYALGNVGIVIAGILYIALLVAGIAIGIKRLHDRDKSGWWLLLFYLGPAILSVVGVGLGVATGSGGLRIVFSLASLAVSIWALVELGCLRGTVGANKYGADPLWPAAAKAIA